MAFKMRFYLLLLFIALSANGLAKEIISWVEKVRIYPGDMVVKARIDTGAKTSSLGVEAMNIFERGHEKWVRFSLINYKGKRLSLERKVFRTVKIKRDHGLLHERPVVIMGVCLASTYQETEVGLAYRKHMNYQMLIGRKTLADHFLVDPNSSFSNKPRCDKGME